jgi:hypothetical protein
MAISAKTLFHFTKFEFLQSIISDLCFKPRFCAEQFLCYSNFIVFYPMVCFCDISLSQIYQHAVDYNRCGIGLTKTWGKRNKINPVFYLQEKSFPYDILFSLLMDNNYVNLVTSMVIKITDNQLKNKINELFKLSSFLKPTTGKIWDKEKREYRRHEVQKSTMRRFSIKNFYNEREWRYVPFFKNNIDDKSLIPLNFLIEDSFVKNEHFSREIFDERNEKIEKYGLYFSSDDVKYIIVENEEMLHGLANFIEESLMEKTEKKNLTTKIITLKQIKDDF